MSVQNVPKFFKLATTDAAFADRVHPLTHETGRDYAERMSALSQEIGLPFSRSEFLNALEPDPHVELVVEELGNVAARA